MRATILVFLGGGLGAALRHFTSLAAARLLGTEFPWGTILVNIAGSFAMGLLVGVLAFAIDPTWKANIRLFLATGVLGGFTTFSAFSLDVMLLWERGAQGTAAVYVLCSLVLSVLALAVGLEVVRNLS
jgi:CrcB protein